MIFNDKKNENQVIEKILILYKQIKKMILSNMTGLIEIKKRNDLIDRIFLQMIILWELQELELLNNDKKYFIYKFREIKLGVCKKFKGILNFLISLFRFLNQTTNQLYLEDEIFGKFLVLKPAIFFLEDELSRFELNTIIIPDKFFYIDGKTDFLDNLIDNGETIPLFNLIESIYQSNYKFDGFLIGKLYEKLLTLSFKKKLGAYYTPKTLSDYISEKSIKNYINYKIQISLSEKSLSIATIFNEGNSSDLEVLFNILKNIKILDPALGSGHFLHSSVIVLLNLYEKIWDFISLNDFDNKWFKIEDLKGNNNPIFLNKIKDRNYVRFLILYYIIIPTNIYGTDIDQSAVNITKSRLFLLLIEHYDKNNEWKYFPDTYFNIKCGNSLIGLLNWVKEFKMERQLFIDSFLRKSKANNINNTPILIPDLQNIIDKLDLSPKVTNQIFQIISELDIIYLQDNFNLLQINKLIKRLYFLKNKLLIYLNSSSGLLLGRILSQIIQKFSIKLDLTYLSKYGLKSKYLNKLKLFHWPLNFPEVFSNQFGFDIIIGNPPYLRQEEINHLIEGFEYKTLLSRIFNIFESTFDYSVYFMLRSLELLNENGFHAFLITNKWMKAKYGYKIRNLFKNQIHIVQILDFSGVSIFKGLTVDTMVYLIQKIPPNNKNQFYYNHPLELESMEKGGYYLNQNELNTNIWVFVDHDTTNIKTYLNENTIPLKELNVNIYFGIKTGYNKAFIVNNDVKRQIIRKNPESEIFFKPLLRGRDINHYYFDWKKLWLIVIPAGWTNRYFKEIDHERNDIKNAFRGRFAGLFEYLYEVGIKTKGKGKGLFERDDQGDFWWELRPCDYYSEIEKPKLVWNRISSRVRFLLIPDNFYVLDSTFFIISELSKFLLLILESSLNPFLIKNYCAYLGKGFYAAGQYIEQIPIKIPKNITPFITISDYLLFLNTNPEHREKLREIIDFFSKKIIDSLVYELYFEKKFKSDGLITNFISIISQYLRPIEYDRYAKLYIKKILNKPYSQDELIKLETNNLQIIMKVHEFIIKDKRIFKQINLIKNHPWIKIIESN
ncbi:MAG: Eco57I restriction-modification methylase domain-containing protein [Candidatus Helarchaeota archaeon]